MAKLFKFPSEIAYDLVSETRQAFRDSEVLYAESLRSSSTVAALLCDANLTLSGDTHDAAREAYYCLQSAEWEAARVNPRGWQALLAASYRQRNLAAQLQLEVERNESDHAVGINTSDASLCECIEDLLSNADSNRQHAQRLLEGGAL